MLGKRIEYREQIGNKHYIWRWLSIFI